MKKSPAEGRTLFAKDGKVIQFIKFLGFSLGAGVIEFLTFTLIVLLAGRQSLVDAGVRDTWVIVAEVTSVVLSCLFNFTLNRKYTFKSANNMAVGMILYGLFYLVVTPLGVQFILLLTHSGWNEFLAKATKMILNFLLDFTFCKFVLFRTKQKRVR